jgi:tetratricopeptide (TPR) repeat protein
MKKKKQSVSGDMEKTLRGLKKILAEKNISSQEELQKFMDETLGKELPEFEDNSPSEQAQSLIYDAWECDDAAEVISLAKKALELDENCADAYVLLARNAETIEEGSKLYLKGIEAGKISLGDNFEKMKGHFWGFTESRPFMRAMSGYSNTLWSLNEKLKSVEIMKEMIKLNPNDNQGVRHSLITKLLIINKLLDAEKLISEYENDESAEWYYSKAYICFMKRSKRYLADNMLRLAMEYNPYVPLYMYGIRELPEELPEFVGVGDENEAISYTHEAMELWGNNKKAAEWMGKMHLRMKDKLDNLIN